MKVLASLAIAGAVLAFLAAALVSGPVIEVLIIVLALAVAVLLFLQRDPASMAAGAILVVTGLLLLLPALGGINTEGGSFGDYLSIAHSHAFAVILALLVAAVPLVAWDGCGPMWARWTGAGGLALAAVFALVVAFTQAEASQFGTPLPLTILTGLLALAGIVPAVFLLRDESRTTAEGKPTSG